jgi:hypothetical protein
MTNKTTEAIAKAETELGKPLSAYERLNVIRNLPSDDDKESRLKIALEQTLPGIELMNDFNEKIEAANLVNNLHLRHVACLNFETGKRDLMKKFNAGQIERIGKPQKEAA